MSASEPNVPSLVSIPQIGAKKAEKLIAAGIHDRAQLQSLTPLQLQQYKSNEHGGTVHVAWKNALCETAEGRAQYELLSKELADLNSATKRRRTVIPSDTLDQPTAAAAKAKGVTSVAPSTKAPATPEERVARGLEKRAAALEQRVQARRQQSEDRPAQPEQRAGRPTILISVFLILTAILAVVVAVILALATDPGAATSLESLISPIVPSEYHPFLQKALASAQELVAEKLQQAYQPQQESGPSQREAPPTRPPRAKSVKRIRDSLFQRVGQSVSFHATGDHTESSVEHVLMQIAKFLGAPAHEKPLAVTIVSLDDNSGAQAESTATCITKRIVEALLVECEACDLLTVRGEEYHEKVLSG
eukprot:scaffold3016_cov415-Prasinococcus_capsulatus_cf.AAC.6